MNTSFAQFDVSGTVQSAGGEPLVGVTVAVKNTNVGTATDIDGKYVIQVPPGSTTLVYSYIGYRNEEREVSGSNSVLNVVLEESASELDEVIVSGLATTVKRSNAANAVAQISAKELTGITTQSTFDAALYGINRSSFIST